MVDMEIIGELLTWAFIRGILVVSGFVMYGIAFARADGSSRINISKPASIFIFLLACVVFVVSLCSVIYLIIFLVDIS